MKGKAKIIIYFLLTGAEDSRNDRIQQFVNYISDLEKKYAEL